jgi:hypothetical protein
MLAARRPRSYLRGDIRYSIDRSIDQRIYSIAGVLVDRHENVGASV